MEHPKRLGKYDIVQVLGEGAMGVVYQGHDPGIDRSVAIKTIRKALLQADGGIDLAARFRNEAKAVGRLSHPGIVAIYETLAEIEGRAVRRMDDKQVWDLAFEGKDSLAVAALDRFCLSLGAVAGGLIAAGFQWLGIGPQWHLVIVAAIMTPSAFLITRSLSERPPAPSETV